MTSKLDQKGGVKNPVKQRHQPAHYFPLVLLKEACLRDIVTGV